MVRWLKDQCLSNCGLVLGFAMGFSCGVMKLKALEVHKREDFFMMEGSNLHSTPWFC